MLSTGCSFHPGVSMGLGRIPRSTISPPAETARFVSAGSSNVWRPDPREPETVGPDAKRWHIDLGFQVSYTKLAETKQMLDQRLDRPLATDLFNLFDHPMTPINRRTRGGLNSFTLGIGRNESDWLTWTAYFVGGAGTDREHQRLGPLNLKTNFRYGSYRVGLRSEIYPWGEPLYGRDLQWEDRLRRTRPFLYLGVEGGYVSGEGRGSYSVAPRTLYRDKEPIRDWILGFPIGAGFRLPLDAHWSFALMGDYTFHVYRPQEYNSWNVVASLRYRL
ncbi:MAG: hypothetical protein ACE5E5_03050 [Phycisphaerae bacterium]